MCGLAVGGEEELDGQLVECHVERRPDGGNRREEPKFDTAGPVVDGTHQSGRPWSAGCGHVHIAEDLCGEPAQLVVLGAGGGVAADP